MTGDPMPESGGESGGEPTATRPETRLALITGMSGAGNATAIHALEDMGFEAIDNLPLSFLERLFPTLVDPAGPTAPADPPASAAPDAQRPVALGIDVRTRGFSAAGLLAKLAALRAAPGVAPKLVFLDCADEVLLDRFKTTRRRHPLAPARGVETGILLERGALLALREHADLVIDTTELSPHDLKARLAGLFDDPRPERGLAIGVQSFSYKHGPPREADMTVDCRFLRNPYWRPELRAADGRAAAVADFVAGDPLYAPFLDRLADLLKMLLPAYRREGKAYFTIGLGCSGGRHRSVAAAEDLARRIRAADWPVTLRHRELEAGELEAGELEAGELEAGKPAAGRQGAGDLDDPALNV